MRRVAALASHMAATSDAAAAARNSLSSGPATAQEQAETAGAPGDGAPPPPLPPLTRQPRLMPTRVVVVGAGLAGLVATIEALRGGARVTLLDKATTLGGNSAKATSGINGARTRFQSAALAPDSADLFFKDTMDSGGPEVDPNLVALLALRSADAVHWLASFGLQLSALSRLGGHSATRTHREPDAADGAPRPVGWDIVQTLVAHLKAVPPDRLVVLTGARMRRLIIRSRPDMRRPLALLPSATSAQPQQPQLHIHDSPVLAAAAPASGEASEPSSPRSSLAPTGIEVVGVEYENAAQQTLRLAAEAVVLCTGGFAADTSPDSLLRRYRPDLCALATTNGPFATGDGVRAAEQVGALLADMSEVQVHPTGLVDASKPAAPSKILGPEALRGHGGLLMNARGERFVNELGYRDAVSAAIFACGFKLAAAADSPVCAHLLLSEPMVRAFGPAAFGFYANKMKLFRRFESPAACATALGMEPLTLAATLRDYAAAKHAGRDALGKTVFPALIDESEPVWAGLVTPCLHYTMGGVRINASAEVLTQVSSFDAVKSIPGLFAAGEVTGGLHGRNRLGGNSLLECVVFGRVAGARASRCNLSHTAPLAPGEYTPLRLSGRWKVGPFSQVFRFDLPSSLQKLGYEPAQYISVRAVIDDKPQVRYYSPISRYDDLGHVDLLVKVESDAKGMSQHIAALRVGDTLEFSGPHGALRLDEELVRPGQWVGNLTGRARVSKLVLVAGGAGISPMIQILRSVFYHKREDLQIVLLYGACEEGELIFREYLDDMARRHRNFRLHYSLDKPPTAGSTLGACRVGYMTGRYIRDAGFAPADDVRIVLCGPWKMCSNLKPQIKAEGYTDQMFFSFM
jgi:succinate dehydrogenase/fumarate reductase flavoprotein subunit/NAD(P)H-flavin reductase